MGGTRAKLCVWLDTGRMSAVNDAFRDMLGDMCGGRLVPGESVLAHSVQQREEASVMLNVCKRTAL